MTEKDHFFALGVTQREKVGYTSTFAGITFEDIIASLVVEKMQNHEDHHHELLYIVLQYPEVKLIQRNTAVSHEAPYRHRKYR